MNRKRIFDTVRRLLGRGFRQAEVAALDAAIDAAEQPEPARPPAIGDAGIALIKRFEGCARLRADGLVEAYPDPGTGGAPWTIGWGATGPGIGPGTTWTQEQCDVRLADDLARHAAEVADAIGDAPTSQAQFDALVSFHYNTGAIGRATLTRKHKAGDHAGAAREFARWTRAGGRVLAGLVNRRAAEAERYLAGSAGERRPVAAVQHVGKVDAGWEPLAALSRSGLRRSPYMRRIATAVAALALLAGAAYAPAQAQGNGNGKGNAGGNPAPASAQGGTGKNEQANRGNGGGMSTAAATRRPDNRGNGNNQAQGNAMREQRGNAAPADRNNGNGNGKVERAVQRVVPGNGGRGNDERTVVLDRRGVDVVSRAGGGPDRSFLTLGRREIIDGCPPGLAKKNPPCVPPGQARNAARVFAFDRPDWWGLVGLGDGRYAYDGGYLVRLAPDGRIGGYIPLLGGALSIGNAWPSYYQPVELPPYYADYYNLGPHDSYRYADDVIYRVDPQTSAITSIAALLTGDDFAVGQPLPTGYDVYNVPYDYRERYYDTPDALYRYSDGYVYQVDPETRLIAAAIELLAS